MLTQTLLPVRFVHKTNLDHTLQHQIRGKAELYTTECKGYCVGEDVCCENQIAEAVHRFYITCSFWCTRSCNSSTTALPRTRAR